MMLPRDTSQSYMFSARQMSSAAIPRAVTFWDSQWQTRFVNIIEADGDFNGTCSTTMENIPLLINDNHCASW